MKRIILMFVVTLAFTGYAFGECNQADKKALEAFDHAWSDAALKRKAQEFHKLFYNLLS